MQQQQSSVHDLLQPPSSFLPPASLVTCRQCAALEGELDAKGAHHVLFAAAVAAAYPVTEISELLLKRLSEGMQHWKTTLKERVRQQLQQQSDEANAAHRLKAAEILAAWRAREDEVRPMGEGTSSLQSSREEMLGCLGACLDAD
jgi:hypothetical protein